MERATPKESFQNLSEEEIQVITMLRKRTFESIKVTQRNGRIDMIESTQRIEERTKFVDILKEHNYQNIEIKQNDGRVVYINRTIRTKVK